MRTCQRQRVIGLANRTPARRTGNPDKIGDALGPPVVGAHQVNQFTNSTKRRVTSAPINLASGLDSRALRQLFNGTQDTRTQVGRQWIAGPARYVSGERVEQHD